MRFNMTCSLLRVHSKLRFKKKHAHQKTNNMLVDSYKPLIEEIYVTVDKHKTYPGFFPCPLISAVEVPMFVFRVLKPGFINNFKYKETN